MIEAYSVAVRVRLINQATAGLMAIATAAARTQGTVAALQTSLNKIKFLMTGGAALAGVGALGLFGIDKMLKPATEYQHQLSVMRNAGLSFTDMTRAQAAAVKNSGDVITTTYTDNLKTLLDLRSVLGSMDFAITALPVVSKIGAVMAASSDAKVATAAHAQDFAFNMAKSLDIIGKAIDPATFIKEAGYMSKVISAFQGRVSPDQFRSVFQYARQAKFDMNDQFTWELLPTLMLEMGGGNGGGGGSRGVGPMLSALYRVTNQGYISKRALPLWESLGLVTAGTEKNLSKYQRDQLRLSGHVTQSKTLGLQMAPVKDHTLAAQNPLQWLLTTVDTAIKKKYPKISIADERGLLNQLFSGNQLAASAMAEFISKPQNFQRDQQLIRNALDYNAAYAQIVKNDPNTLYVALQSELTNSMIGLGNAAIPMVIRGLHILTPQIQAFGTWMMDHKDVAKGLVYGLGGLSIASVVAGGVMMFAGSLIALKLAFPIVGAGLRFMTLRLGPWGLALYAAGEALYAMWKYWDSSKGVWWNIKNELGMFVQWLWGWAQFFTNALNLPSVGQATSTGSLNVQHVAPDVAARRQFSWLYNELFGGTGPTSVPSSTATNRMAGTFTLTADQLHGIVKSAVKEAAGSLHIAVDGQFLGAVVSAEQGKAAARPSTGPSQYDTHLSPLWPDMNH